MEEYQAEAEALRHALLSKCRGSARGGVYQGTQVALSYNSNRIEGSLLSEPQVRLPYESQALVGRAPEQDVIEAVNSFRALDWALEHVGEPVTAKTMKTLRRIIKFGTPESFDPAFCLGDWMARPNMVGGALTAAPGHVAGRIADLLEGTPQVMYLEDIAAFHREFEQIHPFTDGNGRVGRLLMFKQALDSGIMPFIIPYRMRVFYYQGLTNYDSDPGFSLDILRAAQDVCAARFAGHDLEQ